MQEISDGKVFLQDIADVPRSELDDGYVQKLAVLLQSLDADRDPDNGLDIDEQMHRLFENAEDISLELEKLSDDEFYALLEQKGIDAVDETEALEHVAQMLKEYGGVLESIESMDALLENVEDFAPKDEIDTRSAPQTPDTFHIRGLDQGVYFPDTDPTVRLDVDEQNHSI